MTLRWTSDKYRAPDEPVYAIGQTTMRKTSAAMLDTIAPVMLASSPADNANAVVPGANLVLSFSEVLLAGSGNILIYNIDGSLARSIAVGDTSQVAVNGSSVIVNPSIDLAAGRSYFVNIPAGAFTDLAGNVYAGMGGSTDLNFTTASPSGNDDFPFSTDSSGVVLVGAPGSAGSIEIADDVDLMKVTLVAGTKYTFTLNSSAVAGLSDPYLSLYGADMTLIASDDDGGGAGNSTISYSATSSGVFYLGASDFSSGTGNYVVSAALSTDAADDYAESIQTGASLAIGASTTGAINFSADRDWIKVTLVAGVSYEFELRGADGLGGTLGADFAEAYLQLFDANGAVLRANADGGLGGDPRVLYSASASGTYFLGVSDLYDSATGSYTLSAKMGNDDVGNDTGTLGRVAVAGSVGGTIEAGTDEDWFGVTLKQGHLYRFELSASNSAGGTLGNGDAEAYLKLFGADAALIDYAFEGSAGEDPVLLFTAARSGLHYLAVSELLGMGTGSYTLKAIALSFDDDVGADLASAGSIAVGGQANGVIEQAGDQDWFGVELVANTAYVFDLKGADGGGGTLGAGAAEAYLTLYGPTGLYQQATGGGGVGGDPQISFTPTASGRFFLSVSDFFGAASGSYTIVAAREGAPDLSAPALFSASPADASNGAPVGGNIVFTFNENVMRGSGAIVLRRADGTLVESFDSATNTQLMFSANTLTVNPTAQLGHYTGYTLELAAGSVRDVAGNSFAGLAAYNFTTETLPNNRPSGSVTIGGQAIQGQTLSAANTLADSDGLGSFKYQWLAQGNPITGATGPNLTLAQEQVGQAISVVISYVDQAGHAEAITSAPSAAVANVNDAPVGALTIIGALAQGRQLEAANPTLRDADGLGVLKYQWLANGVAIPGATGAQLLLAQAQVGKSISVVQSYTDAYGAAEKLTSAASAAVANVNDVGEVFINMITPGLLGAVVLDADGFGIVNHQWQSSVDGVQWRDIGAATEIMFRPEGTSLELQLRVLASYTDSFGALEQAVSVALGQAGADRIVGSAGSDAIFGGAGHDRITGGAGNDLIDGGEGIDSALYAGARARYIITHTKTGVLVADSTGSEGLDTLSGIERLLFGGEGYALDTGAGAIGGQAYRLYQAAFDRTPDLAGVGFWINAMDRGASLSEVAAGFVASAEYKALYPANLGNAELVARYYVNILGRPAEQGGLDFWTGVLDNKLSSIAEVLAAISESGENVALTAGVIGAGFPYTPFG